jgi:hypothetical protein
MGIGVFILVLIASLIGVNYLLDYFFVDKHDE